MKQQDFQFHSWGGRRTGAGRKRRPGRPRLRHGARPRLGRSIPVHVTMRLENGMPSLRSQIVLAAFKQCLWRACQGAVRIVHFSLQRDHIHLVVEAPDTEHLGRSMRGFASSFARRLNGVRGTRGRVFADRYHRHDLKTPREVRNALVYVIQNGQKHGGAHPNVASGLDPFSSAAFFDGWSASANVVLERLRATLPPDESPPVAKARFWLMTIGWKRLGLLSLHERPRSNV